MFVKEKNSGNLVEVLDVKALVDPCTNVITGRLHAGEELQDPTEFAKSNMVFPSDEDLPRCWIDPNYKKV